MKITVTLMLAMFAHSIILGQATAKNKFRLGAGISVAAPVYNLTNSSIGAGADFIVQYTFHKNAGIIADAGF
ncbi:MAG: hypothetical protein EOP00_33480, partial [Pedobacter sp.]